MNNKWKAYGTGAVSYTHLPVTEAVTSQDVNNWMNDDEQCELHEEAIVNLITQNKNSDDVEDDTCLLYTSRCV